MLMTFGMMLMTFGITFFLTSFMMMAVGFFIGEDTTFSTGCIGMAVGAPPAILGVLLEVAL